jgi:tRNA(Ile)-lysidine synthase
VTLRVRGGGERLRPDAARPRRRVKDLFQEQGVAPWLRERAPFLWSGGNLVWAPGLGIDVRFQARAGAPSVMPAWRSLA